MVLQVLQKFKQSFFMENFLSMAGGARGNSVELFLRAARLLNGVKVQGVAMGNRRPLIVGCRSVARDKRPMIERC